MEVRYLGFDQQQTVRSYRFDVLEKGQPAKHFIVTADLSLFAPNHVRIQDGPALCASKLTADLEGNTDGAHELTAADLRSHANARIMAEEQRSSTRKPNWRNRPPEA